MDIRLAEDLKKAAEAIALIAAHDRFIIINRFCSITRERLTVQKLDRIEASIFHLACAPLIFSG